MPTNSQKKRQRVTQGPTGDKVAENLARIRKASGITAEQLVADMAKAGHKLPRTAISDIENCYRKIGVDDLMALSVALNVNPNALLLPNYGGGDVDMSYDVTAIEEGATGEDVWAWADGWQALPQQRAHAPLVDESATGMERGRQEAKRRRVTEGWDFLNRIRPQDEVATRRDFLANVRERVNELSQGERLLLWLFSEKDETAFELAEYPAFTFQGPAAVEIERHIKARLKGFLREPNNAHYLDSVLKELEQNGND